MNYLYVFLASLVVLIIGDLLWLGVIMKNFYQSQLAHLVGNKVVWPAAIVFYLVFTAGILFFAVYPNLGKGLLQVLIVSALLGGFAYATYDLTNHATLKDWPVVVTMVDIVWGMFLSGLLGTIAYLVHQSLS